MKPNTKLPILVLLRRDLRLVDNQALFEASQSGRPVIPVFIYDEIVESLGAAPKWRFGLGLEAFSSALEAVSSRLILRRGKALDVVQQLIQETGAQAVYWSRCYDPASIARDTAIKTALKQAGIEAQSFAGHLLFEPWEAKTKAGGFFKVYSPFWRAVSALPVAPALPAPETLLPPDDWPRSDVLCDWEMGKAMDRGAEIVAKYVCVGEAAARKRLHSFLETKVDGYKAARDFPEREATSRLSENLTYGEISPRTIWHAGQLAVLQGAQGAEHFCKELAWREFSYHLLFHTPHITTRNWREKWDGFPWRGESDTAEKWRRGLTGEPIVDAAMREVYVTGTMHNRMRMIVGSYLTKHLLTHWSVGKDWFEDVLIDWDPAANAMGWQWIAGCGPDAAPYFRVFNPQTQAAKFDPLHRYHDMYLTAGQGSRAADFFAAIPRSWALDATSQRPAPIVDLKAGRMRALAAYADTNSAQDTP